MGILKPKMIGDGSRHELSVLCFESPKKRDLFTKTQTYNFHDKFVAHFNNKIHTSSNGKNLCAVHTQIEGLKERAS